MGKVNAEIHVGRCHKDLQTPYGKQLSVSCIGTEPYLDDDYFEGDEDSFIGSDMLVTEILAEKFNFFPNFVAEKESFYGMMDGVNQHFMLHFQAYN